MRKIDLNICVNFYYKQTKKMTTVYNICDFDAIKNDGFNYTMPDITLRLINKIANMVGSPNYIKTPVFKKKHTYIPKKADGTQDVFNNTKHDSKQNHNGKKHGKNRRRNKNKAKEITMKSGKFSNL